nr:helix-turn-helix domain-containing protein [Neoroseomonas alba]
MHLGPGSPIFARVQGPVRWSGISFRTEALLGAVAHERLPGSEAFQVRRDARGHAGLAVFAHNAARLAAVEAARFGFDAVRRALVEDALRLAAAAAQDPLQGDGAFRAVHRRVVLVSEAEDFLAAHIGQPLYSEDLQAALGVPMRTLHNAFVAVHGMSVHRYLRLRRLHLARAALRASNGSPAQVKIAALTHGFWHLGRFAQDYRTLFGELPSETSGAPLPGYG